MRAVRARIAHVSPSPARLCSQAKGRSPISVTVVISLAAVLACAVNSDGIALQAARAEGDDGLSLLQKAASAIHSHSLVSQEHSQDGTAISSASQGGTTTSTTFTYEQNHRIATTTAAGQNITSGKEAVAVPNITAEDTEEAAVVDVVGAGVYYGVNGTAAAPDPDPTPVPAPTVANNAANADIVTSDATSTAEAREAAALGVNSHAPTPAPTGETPAPTPVPGVIRLPPPASTTPAPSLPTTTIPLPIRPSSPHPTSAPTSSLGFARSKRTITLPEPENPNLTAEMYGLAPLEKGAWRWWKVPSGIGPLAAPEKQTDEEPTEQSLFAVPLVGLGTVGVFAALVFLFQPSKLSQSPRY